MFGSNGQITKLKLLCFASPLYLWPGVELVNTINGGRFDRAARAFKVQLALSEAGPWTEVLDEELEDPRSQAAPLPLQRFSFPLTEARYIRFLLLSWYGYGSGGLQYFAPVLTFLGMSLVSPLVIPLPSLQLEVGLSRFAPPKVTPSSTKRWILLWASLWNQQTKLRSPKHHLW